MHNGSFESLVKIIKTTYIRNENRKKNKKKLSEIDEEYFIKAESYLYNELSIVLNLSFEETKDCVIKRVSELINNYKINLSLVYFLLSLITLSGYGALSSVKYNK